MLQNLMFDPLFIQPHVMAENGVVYLQQQPWINGSGNKNQYQLQQLDEVKLGPTRKSKITKVPYIEDKTYHGHGNRVLVKDDVEVPQTWKLKEINAPEGYKAYMLPENEYLML